jgi:oxygen-dependent protoporphyrinogen oxidase
MPQYNVGHLKKVERIKSHLVGLPTLQLATTAIKGVGVPDAVRHGNQAAENLVENLVALELTD